MSDDSPKALTLKEWKRLRKAARLLEIQMKAPSEQPAPQVPLASKEALQGFQSPGSQEQEQYSTTLGCDMEIATASSVRGDNHPVATVHPADDDQATPGIPTIPVGDVVEPPQVPESPPASWEDTYQHVLNTSILSGRFEDLRIVAFSRRVRSGRAGEPREMYANSALVERALEKGHLYKAKAFQSRDTLSVESIADYSYVDDSDLEDEDGTEDFDNQRNENTDGEDTHTATRPHTPPINPDAPASEETSSRAGQTDGGFEATTPTEDFVSVSASDEDDHIGEDDRRSVRMSTPANASRPHAQQDNTRRTSLRVDKTPAIIVTDTAFQTWRTFVFYAYTHRISFAPLRSQGAISASVGATGTGARLPSCSPKSMYRLAVKYGNAELQQLSRDDLASKLSTENILSELFSTFTSRYPEVQDMELDFLLAHLQHPDVTDRLPSWIGRFARGELKECADTFERFIRKLAGAASAGSASASVAARSI